MANHLTLNRSILRGIFNGKAILCVVMPSVQVPEGDYLLIPAVNDPRSGPTVMMVKNSNQSSTNRFSIATRFAQNTRGIWFVPDPQDEVLVAFNREDLPSPFVLGGLWNGGDTPPESSTYQLGTRTVRGRNSIRVAVGFAHLIKGLKDGPVPVKVKHG